jgi:tetratricopeptide (TPR) repeat protein
MKVSKSILSFALLATATLAGCELAEVTNPNVTDEVFLETPNSAQTWVNGLRRQLASTMNQVVVGTELVSDNYFNNRTLSSKVFDIPQIESYDLDVNNLQKEIHRLREMAEYGLDKVILADKSSTDADKAAMLFYKAYAHLLSGELFVALPGSSGGAVLTPEEHLSEAIKGLDEAIALHPDQEMRQSFTLLKARAYYRLGDMENATKLAGEVLTNKTLLFQVMYDGVNGLSNSMQTYLFSSTYNEFAPLPRLDFLDPKYFHQTTVDTDQRPVTIVKAEEAYLILAEAGISSGDVAGAKQYLKELLTEVVHQRAVLMLDDSKETRNGGNRTDYPLTEVLVKFSAADDPKEGYVLNRTQGDIKAYPVSGTMVTSEDIDAVSTQDEALYLLYRLRQEIFFAEGRRMADLGIKFPVSEIEALNNAAVTAAHQKAQLPSFIPAAREMDDFSYDAQGQVVTMTHDMNQVLVQNKGAREIFPFID